jgi:hypothetical protein
VPLRKVKILLEWDFHAGSGLLFWEGYLYWTDAADCDTLGHEACHAMGIPIDDRAAWRSAAIATDEDNVMALQVELWRGVKGVGIGRALEWMNEVGYQFGSTPGGRGEIASAQAWWKSGDGPYGSGRADLPDILPWAVKR